MCVWVCVCGCGCVLMPKARNPIKFVDSVWHPCDIWCPSGLVPLFIFWTKNINKYFYFNLPRIKIKFVPGIESPPHPSGSTFTSSLYCGFLKLLSHSPSQTDLCRPVYIPPMATGLLKRFILGEVVTLKKAPVPAAFVLNVETAWCGVHSF